jgi:hypothetical protein
LETKGIPFKHSRIRWFEQDEIFKHDGKPYTILPHIVGNGNQT